MANYMTRVYGMIKPYRSSDLGRGYSIKIGESYQPPVRAKQVGAFLRHQTPEPVSIGWEHVGHLLALYEFGQNRRCGGTEYFGKFRTREDAEKALDRFWKKFMAIIEAKGIDSPYDRDRLAYKIGDCNWWALIRCYIGGFKNARNTRYPYRLRPFMLMDDWDRKLFAA